MINKKMQKYVIVTEKFGEKMNANVWLENFTIR